MLQTVLSTVLRTVFAFFLVLTVARLMGRKAISQMTFFDLVVMITLGSVTANLAMGPEKSTVTITVVLIAFGLLAVLTGYLHIKSIRFRKIVDSEPVTAIENGKINEKNLKKVRYTLDELTTLLREKNIFNYADVEFAIIENDGQLSVLPKSQKAPLTPSDMNVPTSYKGLTRDLIMDGEILSENLEASNLDENWLNTQLGNNGISSASQVFYAGLDTAGNLYISEKQPGRKEYPGQHGIE